MATLVVRPADTTVAQALNDLPILSTTTLLTLVEGSCSAALAEHFAPGETSVTSDVSLTTMGTVGVGAEIRGMCSQCSAAEFTMKDVIEARLHEFVSDDIIVEEQSE